MGIQKITFDGSSISAKIDAEIYHFLLSKEVGILKGFKNGVSFTLSNNKITFLDGYVSVYGRLVYIENNTEISITPDSNKKGFVILGINTSTNEAKIYLKEQSSSYPILTTTNLLDTNGLYELVLCAYAKTTSSVTLDLNYERLFIYSYKDLIDKTKNDLKNELDPVSYSPTKVSNGIYKIMNTNSYILSRSLLAVILSNNTVIMIPGAQLFLAVGSNASISYRHNGSDYSMYLSYANGTITFTCGSTSHVVSKIVFYTL